MYFHQLDELPEQGVSDTSPSGAATLPYREALEETEKRQREEYLRDCKDVDVLQTLEKEFISPGDRVRKLEKQLSLLPTIVDVYKQIGLLKTKLITGAISEKEFWIKVKELLDNHPEVLEFPFPSGYAVGSLSSEMEKLRCKLSRARWEFMVWNRTHQLPGRLPVR
jgi:hypothetical protein